MLTTTYKTKQFNVEVLLVTAELMISDVTQISQWVGGGVVFEQGFITVFTKAGPKVVNVGERMLKLANGDIVFDCGDASFNLLFEPV